MGDVAMTVPVVASLARNYPDDTITVVSRGFARAFYEGMAPNVRFIEADLKGRHKGIKGLNTLLGELKPREVTHVADLHDVLRTKYLRYRFMLKGKKVEHINKHRKGKKRLAATSNKVMQQQPTSFQNYADVFARLGFPVRSNFRSLFKDTSIKPLDIEEKIGVKQNVEHWIGIAPFAAHEGKIYPLRLMQRLIASLIEKHPNCRIFLFGGGNKEMEVFRQWKDEMKGNITIAADHLKGLREELSLMSQLDVMLSMDSANMHLASLAGTRVVSVWGATHPYAGFMGWNQGPELVVQLPLECRPCSIYGNKPCLRHDFACMANISIDMIMAKIEANL